MWGRRDYVSDTDGTGAFVRHDGGTPLKGVRIMNVHDGLLSELVRQRRLDILDEATHWTSRVRLRRRNRREHLT